MSFNFKKLLGEQTSTISNRLKKTTINLGVGDPEFRVPKKEIVNLVKKIENKKISYTNPSGIINLKKKISKKYNNLNLSFKNIIITPGGKTGIFFSFLMLGEKGKEVIIPDIGFPTYLSLARYTGMKVKNYKLNEKNFFKPLAKDIISLISKKTKFILINSPHNPTSSVMDDLEMKKLAMYLKNKNIYLVSDEIYSDLIFKEKKYKSFGQFKFLHKKLIIINGWSKNYGMTGWRMGWSYWPNKFIKSLELMCLNSFTSPNMVSQKLVEKIILNKTYVKSHIKQLKKNRDYIFKKYKNLNSIIPEGAIYLFLKIPKNFKSDHSFCEFFFKKFNIAIVPGSSFGKTANRYVRVNFSKKLSNVEKFIKNYLKINA